MGGQPNFLVLGAAKSGTTSLFDYLDQHPDVFFTPAKEPTFFEAEYERGLDHYMETYFAGWSGQHAIGEARSYNLYLPFVAERVHALLPDARLIAILRNPVDRAYSHWWHRYTRRQESLDFERALAENRRLLADGPRFLGEAGAAAWRRGVVPNSTAVTHRTYLDLGFYAEQIARYDALFPRAQLQIVLFDDLQRDPTAVARRLWAHLGVDPDVDLLDTAPKNVANEVMETRAWSTLRRANRSLRFTALLPRPLRELGRRALRGSPARRPPMKPETRAALLAEFAPHNAALSERLGRDLGAWEA